MPVRLVTFITAWAIMPMAQAQPPSSVDLMTTAGSLILVLSIILLLAWLMKRMKLPTLGNQKGLKVIRQMSVGTKERIAVVQAGDEQFLIGITTQSINLISKLESPIEDDLKATDSSNSASFSKQLSQLLPKNDK